MFLAAWPAWSGILSRIRCGSGSRRCCQAQPARRYRYPGRKRADDRAVLAGIVFVRKTGQDPGPVESPSRKAQLQEAA